MAYCRHSINICWLEYIALMSFVKSRWVLHVSKRFLLDEINNFNDFLFYNRTDADFGSNKDNSGLNSINTVLVGKKKLSV